METLVLPGSDSAQLARRIVTEALTRLDRSDLVDDATLVVSELVANGVLHARTEISLSVEQVGEGIRVAVTDGSSVLPIWGPASPSATSGRGLWLVERLSNAWGVEPLPGGGKVVWAELDQVVDAPEETTAADLLDLWDDDAWSTEPHHDSRAQADIAVDIEVDIGLMLASRVHTEDLVRELQLALLNASSQVTTVPTPPSVLWLARRLDAATEEFQEARRQLQGETLNAAKKGLTHATLHLQLQHSDAEAALRWLGALDEADSLTSAGILLVPPFLAAMTAFRRDYIAAIVRQLRAAA
jgi:anti-sigma regulatory factor (Ser/Thr protein kinase)